jgi:hypothetical protein
MRGICGNKERSEPRPILDQFCLYDLARRSPVPFADPRAILAGTLRVPSVFRDPRLGPLDGQHDNRACIENYE